MATAQATMSGPAIAVVRSDGRIERTTAAFTARAAARAWLDEQPAPLLAVARGESSRAVLDVADTTATVEAVHDAAGERFAVITLTPDAETLSAPGAGSPLLDEDLDASPAIVFIKDLQGRYLRVNTKHGELVGGGEAELLGKDDSELNPRVTVDGPRLAGRDPGLPEPLQLEYIVPAFEGRPALSALRFVVRDGAGEPLAVCGVASPMSDPELSRREAERLIDFERIARLDPSQARDELLVQWGLTSALPADGGDREASATASSSLGRTAESSGAASAADLAALQDERLRAEQARVTAEQALAENAHLRSELELSRAETEQVRAVVRREHDDAETARTASQAARAEAAQALVQIEQLEAGTATLSNRLEQSEAEARTIRHRAEQAETEAVQARARAEQAEAELVTLRARVEELQTAERQSTGRIEELQGAERQARLEIEQLEGVARSTRMQLDELEIVAGRARASAEEAENSARQWRTRAEQAEAALPSAGQSHAPTSDGESVPARELAELRTRLAELEGERALAVGQAQELREALAAERARGEELRGSLDAARAEADAARGESAAARAEADAARQESAAARAETDAARRELLELRGDVLSARGEADAARRETDWVQREAQAERQQAEQARSALEQAHTALEQARAQAEQARLASHEAEAELHRARLEVESAGSGAARDRAEAERLGAEAAHAGTELLQARAELEQARAELEQARVAEPAAATLTPAPAAEAISAPRIVPAGPVVSAPDPATGPAAGVRWVAADQRALSVALGDVDDVRDGLTRAVSVLAQRGGWQLVTAWMPDAGGRLRATAAWSAAALAALEQEGPRCPQPVRDSVLGSALYAREPVWIELSARDGEDARLSEAARHGVRTALLLPIREGVARIGLLELLSVDAWAPEPDIVAGLEAVALQLGQFVALKRARRSV